MPKREWHCRRKVTLTALLCKRVWTSEPRWAVALAQCFGACAGRPAFRCVTGGFCWRETGLSWANKTANESTLFFTPEFCCGQREGPGKGLNPPPPNQQKPNKQQNQLFFDKLILFEKWAKKSYANHSIGKFLPLTDGLNAIFNWSWESSAGDCITGDSGIFRHL